MGYNKYPLLGNGYIEYPYRMELDNLLDEKATAKVLGITISGLRKLRYAKKIPYIRLSYRCVRFDLNSVKRALRKLEITEDAKSRS